MVCQPGVRWLVVRRSHGQLSHCACDTGAAAGSQDTLSFTHNSIFTYAGPAGAQRQRGGNGGTPKKASSTGASRRYSSPSHAATHDINASLIVRD